MNIYKSSLWFSDIDLVLSALPELTSLNGSSVLITGSTGLICSALIDVLIRFNETYDGNIRIIAAGRNKESIKDRFGEYSDKKYFQYVRYDASKPLDIPAAPDYIIHGAGNSSPDMIVKEPVETILANILGIDEFLKFNKTYNVKKLLYISSSEVYGNNRKNAPFSENDCGFFEILNPRSSYSIGKCAAETLCISYAYEYNIDTVIARPGHIYGPTARKQDRHVSSEWAFLAASGHDIIMKSDGSQLRSYVYCLDCAYALLTILLKGSPSEAYNISNPKSVISIRQMGEILAAEGGVKLLNSAPSNEEKKAFNPMNNSSLDGKKLSMLGFNAIFDADTGLSHTIRIIRESGCSS